VEVNPPLTINWVVAKAGCKKASHKNDGTKNFLLIKEIPDIFPPVPQA
jgi:hypothetical protein